ncbi:MAG: TRAP transporter large permease subunit [Thermodesulfobacteriota bacterium]
MSPETIGGVGVVVLLVLMYARMSIGLSMMFVGFWGLVFLTGFKTAFAVLATVPYRTVADYPITAIPLFVLMGVVVSNMGVGKDLYYTANKWIGSMRGGLAMATVAACAGFAAICGSSSATAATMGKIAVPEMRQYRYNERLSSGCVAAGGTMGILIPPSMGFILYGILTGQSIGHLFMAGILPGITQALFYMGTIYIICRANPDLGPAGPKSDFKEKVASLGAVWPTLALFLLVIGGIYQGVCTPTEAGAVGAFGSIVITFLMRRATGRRILDSILETGKTTGMIIVMIVGAFVFSNFMAMTKLPVGLGEFVANLPVSRYIILIIIIFVYILLGMFLDIFAAIIFTVPIFYPVIEALGFDAIWYGVLMVRVIEIGLITPPVGMNVFILSGVVGTQVSTIFRGVVPFVIADTLNLVVLIAFPIVSLFIPSRM